jgi:hypothetical protein
VPGCPAFSSRSCIQRLLQDDQNPRAEDIECLCKLLSTVGQQLESPQVKGKAGMSQQQVHYMLAALCLHVMWHMLCRWML